MSANPSIRVIDNFVERNGGLVWHRLHPEREEICEVLLLSETARHSDSRKGREVQWKK